MLALKRAFGIPAGLAAPAITIIHAILGFVASLKLMGFELLWSNSRKRHKFSVATTRASAET